MGYTPRAGWGANRTYTSRAHYDAARSTRSWRNNLTQTGDVMRGGVAVHIDTREIEKLRQALIDAGAGYKRSEAILAQSLNRAGRRVTTQYKRFIKLWTGIRRFASVTKRMFPVVASPGNMRAGVNVSGRHFRITKADFGAAWRGPSSPGGTHKAWNRAQTAKGSFMPRRFTGGGAYGGGLLFTRTSKARFPIKPLWGPNPVREMQRHAPMCRAIVTKEARWFLRESARRAEVELRKAKAKYGL